MSNINVYLSFNGNCREAMNHYKECIGGELTLQSIGESPLADKMPPQMKDSILHATLKKGGMLLMASDMIGKNGLVRGNSVGLCLHCESEDEIFNTYEKLSSNGNATHPPEVTFRGALFGDLIDKFGNQWLLSFSKNK